MDIILTIVGWIALAAVALVGTWALATGLVHKRRGKSLLGLTAVVVALGLVTLGWKLEGSVLQASFGLGVLVTIIVAYIAIIIALARVKKTKERKPETNPDPIIGSHT